MAEAGDIRADAWAEADSTTDGLARSRQRCREIHRLDPASGLGPVFLSAAEFADRRDAAGPLLRLAAEELDRLHAVLARSGFTALLSDAQAVILDHRPPASDTRLFHEHGAWTGAVWSEAVEGTNGIGTAIAEARPITVSRGSHYRRRHRAFTCAAVPIFGPQGELVASLTVASQGREEGERLALVFDQVRAAGGVIAQRLFRLRFGGSRIILAVAESIEEPALLAIDMEGRIVGANLSARFSFGLDDQALIAGIGIAALFRCVPDVLVRGLYEAVQIRIDSRSGRSWHTLISPPYGASPAYGRDTGSLFHVRPRWLATTAPLSDTPTPSGARLAPHVLRRIIRHIDAHLGGKLSLTELGLVAGLTKSHFCMAFRGSTGMPPHRWILTRRIEQAKQILAETRKSVIEIALALGFSSSSHFATAFSQMVGICPTEYRAMVSPPERRT